MKISWLYCVVRVVFSAVRKILDCPPIRPISEMNRTVRTSAKPNISRVKKIRGFHRSLHALLGEKKKKKRIIECAQQVVSPPPNPSERCFVEKYVVMGVCVYV